MINLNEYFEGAVKSLAYENDGKSSVGVIDTGEFEFGTSTPETMLVIEGEMRVLLPGNTDWQLFTVGQQFEVTANASFKVKVNKPTSYFCKYK